jgi:hypothetical protein
MLKVAQWLEWRLMAWDKEQPRLSMVEEVKRNLEEGSPTRSVNSKKFM